MSLKCPLCGVKYSYDRKICHTCEETAINSNLASQDGRHDNKWRCDNFLEVNCLAFGSSVNTRSELSSKMIECPECGVEYSYGRIIFHTCEHNSIPFGKLLGPDFKARKWNCDTAIACTKLLTSETEYEWNKFSSIKYNKERLDGKKNLLIYE